MELKHIIGQQRSGNQRSLQRRCAFCYLLSGVVVGGVGVNGDVVGDDVVVGVGVVVVVGGNVVSISGSKHTLNDRVASAGLLVSFMIMTNINKLMSSSPT